MTTSEGQNRFLGIKDQDSKKGVFINCPFDDGYKDIFEAIVFTTIFCGFEPRCSKENNTSSQNRLSKIFELIENCHIGIHDLSEIGLSDGVYPRFNMPLELGLFQGAKFFGEGEHQNKVFLILDKNPHSYKITTSDLSGFDAKHHNGKVDEAIKQVRDFLYGSLETTESENIAGAKYIFDRFNKFKTYAAEELPTKGKTFDEVRQNFNEMRAYMKFWISKINALSSNS